MAFAVFAVTSTRKIGLSPPAMRAVFSSDFVVVCADRALTIRRNAPVCLNAVILISFQFDRRTGVTGRNPLRHPRAAECLLSSPISFDLTSGYKPRWVCCLCAGVAQSPEQQ